MEPNSKAQVSVLTAGVQTLYLCLLPSAATLALAFTGQAADLPAWAHVCLAPWSVGWLMILVGFDSQVRVRLGPGLLMLFDAPVLVIATQLLGGGIDPARAIIFDGLVECVSLQLAALMVVLTIKGSIIGRVIFAAFFASIPGYPLYLASPILANEARANPVEFALLAIAVAMSTWGYWKSSHVKPPPYLESYRRSHAASLIPVGGFVLWAACATCVGVFPQWFA
jgi:hypothetical protein